MTDTTVNAPTSTPAAPDSPTIDTIANSMLVPAEDSGPPEQQRKRRKGKNRNKTSLRAAPETGPDPISATPEKPSTDPSSGVSAGNTDQLSEDTGEDEDRNTPVTYENGEEVDGTSSLSSDEAEEDEVEATPLDSDDDAFLGDPDDPYEATAQTEDSDGGRPTSLGDDYDDALVSVTVDGEDVQMTLSDLKRQHAGEGAIEKRLQEATEARAFAVENYENGKRVLEGVLTEMGQVLFQRTVPEPDEAMRQSNPTAYLLQKDLYDREGGALQQRYNQMQGLMQNSDSLHSQTSTEVRKHATEELKRRLPILDHPTKGPKVSAKIIQTAKENFGYTDKQINDCNDPGMFHMAYWATRGLMAAGKMKAETKVPKPSKPLPRKGQANRSKGSVFSRQQSAASKRAKETGKADDVAATMLMKAPKKRR